MLSNTKGVVVLENTTENNGGINQNLRREKEEKEDFCEEQHRVLEVRKEDQCRIIK